MSKLFLFPIFAHVVSAADNWRRFKTWLPVCLWLAFVCPAVSQTSQAVKFGAETAAESRLDIDLLRQIESRSLPAVLEPGPARFADLPSYYWDENEAIRQRLEQAKNQYEAEGSKPFRALTLIAGCAGVGKTFIKQDIFSKDCPKGAICKFDAKELLEDWKAEGLAEDRPDLFCGDVVLSTLPAMRLGQSNLLKKFLDSQTASFFVIDSLDEIHPDDYEAFLSQAEQFVAESERPFLHVIVLGRPLSFRGYWNGRSTHLQPSKKSDVEIFMLQPPRFETEGDLMVSSWNYHTWRYKLRWKLDDGEAETMPLEDYARWVASGYPDEFQGRHVQYAPNQNMNSQVRKTLLAWAQRPVVNSMLCNLAGNGMIREIAAEFTIAGREFDEREVMEVYLSRWLERHTQRENRPSAIKPRHLDLYLQLIENVAVKYLREGGLDADGFFSVADDDQIELEYEGETVRFPVSRILDRSGLKYLDPREPGVAAYRFEPVWFQRLLVEKYRDLTAAPQRN